MESCHASWTPVIPILLASFTAVLIHDLTCFFVSVGKCDLKEFIALSIIIQSLITLPPSTLSILDMLNPVFSIATLLTQAECPSILVRYIGLFGEISFKIFLCGYFLSCHKF